MRQPRRRHGPASKQTRLEGAGWRVGTVDEFLGLSKQESALVEVKLRLARRLRALRVQRELSQVAVAKLARSSQSRVAKMETGDATVSIDLLVRSLLAIGASPKDIARAIGRGILMPWSTLMSSARRRGPRPISRARRETPRR